MKLLKLDKSS